MKNGEKTNASTRFRRRLGLIAVVLPMLVAANCSRKQESPAASAVQPSATAVQVKAVALSSIDDTYRASGTVHARETADIAARVSANILEVRVHAGEHVQAGQTLIVLEHRDLEASLRRAEAAHSELDSTVVETENAILSAKANLDLARATHRRSQALLAYASISQQDFDEADARLKTAEAALEIAISKRKQVVARRNQSDAEVAEARAALSYATLVAPFAGVVTDRKADPGSLATPGTSLLTIEREGKLRLETSLDETRVNLAKIGGSVEVEIDGFNSPIVGRVGEILPTVDPATRTATVKIDLPATPGLRSGMFGHAAFAFGGREGLFIPQSAVVEHGQVRYVHVVDGGVTKLRLVTLGELRGESREILTGLTEGEEIVVEPPPLLADGSRVVIQKAAK